MAEKAEKKKPRRSAGEGSIYQRASDGQFVGVVNMGGVGKDRRRKYYYGKSKQEVARKIRKAQIELSQGVNIAPERQTMSDLLDKWLAVKKLRVRPLTLVNYTSVAENHIRPYFGKRQVSRISAQDVQGFINDLVEDGMGAGSIQTIRSVLQAVFKQGLEWGMLSRNPAEHVTVPRVEEAPIRALSLSEIKQLLEAIRGDRLEALYLVTLTLGLRRGEVLALRWQDIDLVDKLTLKVTGSLGEINGKLVLGPPKTKGSKRTLPVPEFLAEALSLHYTRQLHEQAAAGDDWKNEFGLVFTNTIGGFLSPRALWGEWDRMQARAGLSGVRFHDLRHSCASLLGALNVHPKVAMQILGHSNTTQTMQTYTHVSSEAMREATAMMAGFLRRDSRENEG